MADPSLLDGDPEAEEVEWPKKQFVPTDMVNKGTAIKIQVSVCPCAERRERA